MTLTVGIIGAGAVVRERHLPAIAAAGADVRWIADPRPGAATEAIALGRGEVRASEDDPAALMPGTDAILVASPPEAHRDGAVAALAAGCHLLCEKPLALTLPECEEIAAAAADAGTIAAIGFNLRHHPSVGALRERLARGDLGRPVAIRSNSISPHRESVTGWVGDPDRGGDVLWEAGSHHVDLWRLLLGEELAEARGVLEGSVASVSGMTVSGVAISALIGWGAGPQNKIEVIGEGGIARADLFSADPLEFTPANATGSEPRERARALGRSLRAAPSVALAAARGGAFHATYIAQWRAFLAAVGGEAPNPAPIADGVAAARATMLIRSACGVGDEAAL